MTIGAAFFGLLSTLVGIGLVFGGIGLIAAGILLIAFDFWAK